MPELPEVEIICRALNKEILNKNIVKAQKITPFKLRIPLLEESLQDLENKKILKIERRAKYILIHLEEKISLIIHLGMSGKILIEEQDYIPKKHDHFLFFLSDDRKIIYNDPRRFGLVSIESTEELENNRLFKDLGVEPFSKDFSLEWFSNVLKNKKQSIKTAIMDNRIIVGVGNIYASESLFLSCIDPQKEAGQLTEYEKDLLRKNILKILQESIDQGGSSIKDYASVNGASGKFQNNFYVYGRAGKNCFNCNAEIKMIRQAGRSGFYCSACQK